MLTSGQAQFALAYELCPIILTNGIAVGLPGGLPIISITQGQDFANGVLAPQTAPPGIGGVASSGMLASADDFFARFTPLPGATAIDNVLGEYPFANQSVAANAIIENPLVCSFLMACPARGPGGFATRQAIFTNLQAQLLKHNRAGGTYTLITPSFIYPDCVLLMMTDASEGIGGDEHQLQTQWRLDFRKPLITLAEAQVAMNILMTKQQLGVAVAGDPPPWSGISPAIGNMSSGQGPSLIPASQSLPAASAGGAAPGQ